MPSNINMYQLKDRYGFSSLLAVAIVLLFSMGTYAAPTGEHQISLGIRAPILQFMWRDGKSMSDLKLDSNERHRWMFMEANLDHMRAWGGEWNIVIVRQWLDGEDNFARIRRIIAEHEKRGLKVVLRVLEEPDIYKRLLKSESKEFGFDQAYFRWIQSLARAAGGKVQYFLIGNEAELDLGKSYPDVLNAPEHLLLTYDQYAKVLRTAVKAIKSVDPGLQVANSGFSDKSLALAMAQDIAETRGLAKAQEFWEA